MRRLTALSEMLWIDEQVQPAIAGKGHTVSQCISPIYAAYAKVFHPIYEDLSVTDKDLTWQATEPDAVSDEDDEATAALKKILQGSTVVYGTHDGSYTVERILWAALAQRLDVPVTPKLNAASFTRKFPTGSWPRRICGPEEGYLDITSIASLIKVLQPHTGANRCLFHCWLLTTDELESLVFEGDLADAVLFPHDVPGVHSTPTHWFPEDRRWFVNTDYDLPFTLVGGSQSLIDDLVGSDTLECIVVQPDTRVDHRADDG